MGMYTSMDDIVYHMHTYWNTGPIVVAYPTRSWPHSNPSIDYSKYEIRIQLFGLRLALQLPGDTIQLS
jgi:hypothetical protein